MYVAHSAPESLRHGFTTLATWSSTGESWTGVLSADPGFEIVWTGDGERILNAPVLTPATRKPRTITATGTTGTMRILRFRSAAVGAWLGREAAELVDGGPVDLGSLDHRWRDAAGAETEAELFQALSRFDAAESDPLVAESLKRLRRPNPTSYPQLAGDVGYSYEQWRRRMLAATGVSPKFLDRYFRLQSATSLARSRPAMSMGEIAFRTGFDSDCRLAAESTAISGRTFRGLAHGFTLPE